MKNKESFSVGEMEDFNKLLNMVNLKDIDSDGFMLGYISDTGGLRQQFDILRYGNNNILNIELKRELPKNGIKSIERQLRKHKLYLSMTNCKKLQVFTYVVNSNKVYTVNSDDVFCEYDMAKINEIFSSTNFCEHESLKIDLTSLIISPYVNPEAFYNHKYFLTDRQYQVKKDIIKNPKEKIIIEGGPGTGKTLVLLDLAKKYQKLDKTVLVIFGAPMSNYEEISKKIGINIRPISKFTKTDISRINADIVIVDETQRVYQEKLDAILNLDKVIRVFSLDGSQALHENEKKKDFHAKQGNFDKDETFLVKKLEGHIRYDPKLSSFIQRLLTNKRNKAQPYNYEKVSLQYFDNKENARKYIRDMVNNKGYVSIEPTEYTTKSTYSLKRKK
jgi:hypothetical protein